MRDCWADCQNCFARVFVQIDFQKPYKVLGHGTTTVVVFFLLPTKLVPKGVVSDHQQKPYDLHAREPLIYEITQIVTKGWSTY